MSEKYPKHVRPVGAFAFNEFYRFVSRYTKKTNLQISGTKIGGTNYKKSLYKVYIREYPNKIQRFMALSYLHVKILKFFWNIPDAPWCWNIYRHLGRCLQKWVILVVNVGRYSSTMEHLGITITGSKWC